MSLPLPTGRRKCLGARCSAGTSARNPAAQIEDRVPGLGAGPEAEASRAAVRDVANVRGAVDHGDEALRRLRQLAPEGLEDDIIAGQQQHDIAGVEALGANPVRRLFEQASAVPLAEVLGPGLGPGPGPRLGARGDFPFGINYKGCSLAYAL